MKTEIQSAPSNNIEKKLPPIEVEKEKIRNKKPIMAICYDFDKTLSPDDMQTFTLIPSFGIDKKEFWEESNNLAENNLMDKNLAWMYELIRHSKFKNKSIKREYFNDIGKNIPLYKGVESWFDRINQYASKKAIQVEHYIISSGLKEIIEGSKIASNFNRIYASSYLYSLDGVAEWPSQAVNYTNKTQFIFRIAKGCFEEYDESVNASMSEEQLYIPYHNIVYIGDSETDIPCMRLVKSKGGYSIGVYDKQKNSKDKVYKLFNDGRINYFAPADYSSRSDISRYMKQIIDDISVKEQIKKEQNILRVDSTLYKMYKEMEIFTKQMEPEIKGKDKKEINAKMADIKEYFEG